MATEIMPGIDPARDIVAASAGRVKITVSVEGQTASASLRVRGVADTLRGDAAAPAAPAAAAAPAPAAAPVAAAPASTPPTTP